FQIYTDRDSVPAETKDLYLLLREIEDRMHAGYYKRQFISFKHSPLDELHDSEIETPPHPIPEIMKKDYTPQFPQ
ncbi:MAG: hypothetical protein KDK27_12110, partial [Leptospiraceae bacterium]|nr:hypothetical protein [Leptospiraceae bacterium]